MRVADLDVRKKLRSLKRFVQAKLEPDECSFGLSIESHPLLWRNHFLKVLIGELFPEFAKLPKQGDRWSRLRGFYRALRKTLPVNQALCVFEAKARRRPDVLEGAFEVTQRRSMIRNFSSLGEILRPTGTFVMFE